MKKFLQEMRDKTVSYAIGAAATIQALQILILPTWLDVVANVVILCLIWLAGHAAKIGG
jgi:hypothetical protein